MHDLRELLLSEHGLVPRADWTETPESLAFLSGTVMAAAGFSAMLWHAEPLNGRLLVALVAMGAFCAAGSICFFLALTHTSASNVSQYHYTQLITGALVSYIAWREVPTISMVLGGSLIVASGIYIAMLASRTGLTDSDIGVQILHDQPGL
ncbi:MAG: DMT family transporter [Terracidiphilus sp.]